MHELGVVQRTIAILQCKGDYARARVPRRSLCGAITFLCICTGSAYGDAILANPVEMLRTAKRVNFVGANELAVETFPAGTVLRSTPRKSAGGLYQQLGPDQRLHRIRWSWRVDQLHRTADLRVLDKEDVAAAIIFVFGEPSLFHRDVPTLAYVWTSTPVAHGTVVRSLRYDSLVYIQLRGRGDGGSWQHEERNVEGDYRSVFGHEPTALRYVAIFNDNDQTGEAASALFGPIHCMQTKGSGMGTK